MILFRTGFTKKTQADYEKVEVLVKSYLDALLLNGQAFGGYKHGWNDDELVALIYMTSPNAIRPQFNSKRGDQAYNEMMSGLRKKPVWSKVAVGREAKYATLQDAPHLYLFTDSQTIEPSVRHGRTGLPIPTHTIPLNDSIRESLYYWSDRYSDYDAMWIHSGSLEKAAYRELTYLDSDLTKEGRELCEEIETATKVPTYYYIMRYYSQKISKQKRGCPACAQPWQHLPNTKIQPFHMSYLKCDTCRIVSQFGFS